MPTDQHPAELLTRALTIYERFEAGDYTGAAAQVTDDVELRFGNAAPIVGRAAYLEGLQNVATHLGQLRHDVLVSYWSEDNSSLGLELNCHYVRQDGAELDLPVFNVFRFRDGLVASYQVFMDITPVLAQYANAFTEASPTTLRGTR